MFQVGAAQSPLPWPPGLPMAGYIRRQQPAVGTHRPLYVRALVTSASDAPTQILLSIDTLSVDAPLTNRVRNLLRQRYGIAPDSVMVTATHTHAAPGGTMQFPVLNGAEEFLVTYAPQLVDLLVETIGDVVDQAISRQQPGTLAIGTAQAIGVASNRRDPVGPVDTSIPFIRLQTASGAPLALVYSFACHPTVLDANNMLYSGDLAGTIAAQIAQTWDCVVFPLTGAAGDVSTRFTRSESTVSELERLARIASAAILSAPVILSEDQTLAAALKRIALRLKPAPDHDSLRSAMERAEQRLQASQTPGERRLAESEIEGLRVALGAKERPLSIETEVQVLRLGQTLIIGFPGEMFVKHGLDIAARLAPAHVLVASYANDYVGYVPTPDTSTGYESDVAVVALDAGESLLHCAEKAARICLTAASD